MVSINRFESYSIQHDVQLLNYVPIYSQLDDKSGDALTQGYFVFDEFLAWLFLRSSVRSNHHNMVTSGPNKNKMATAIMPNLKHQSGSQETSW